MNRLLFLGWFELTYPQKVGSKRSRRECACKRAGEARRDFLQKVEMTERYEKSPAKAGLFEWSVVHSDVVGVM